MHIAAIALQTLKLYSCTIALVALFPASRLIPAIHHLVCYRNPTCWVTTCCMSLWLFTKVSLSWVWKHEILIKRNTVHSKSEKRIFVTVAKSFPMLIIFNPGASKQYVAKFNMDCIILLTCEIIQNTKII